MTVFLHLPPSLSVVLLQSWVECSSSEALKQFHKKKKSNELRYVKNENTADTDYSFKATFYD